MKTSLGTMAQKSKIKRPNAAATALADPRYRARVVKSAKIYNRKNKAKAREGGKE